MNFVYDEAFSRNLGWVTENEQQVLRAKRAAIAGLGGVGGSHLLTLTRLGMGSFNLADFDQFELANFNRQAGATLRHIGMPKLEVMAGQALDINPELELKQLPGGVTRDNLDDFLDGVDIYIDSLDFFALDIRREVFAACHQRGIPAITAAPLGMGAAILCFLPGKMSFEEYFQLAGQTEEEQALRFMLGLAPSGLHMSYLVDATRMDFNAQKGPSTPMACELCAGFAGSYALKILLNRGKVPVAPRGIHYDAYRNTSKTTWRPGGNSNPLQRLGLSIARKRLMSRPEKNESSTCKQASGPVERILDIARWAPSGDNEQPWRFEILGDDRFLVHANDTRDWCVYDLDGSSSQIAVGALLENIAIAASGEGLRAQFTRRSDIPDTAAIIDVSLTPEGSPRPHHLLPYIKTRVTQRLAFSTQSLSSHQKSVLESAVGDGYRVIWIEGGKGRAKMAKLLFHNAHIRLTTPEAFEVHKKNIEWGVKFSEDRLPEHALGLDAPTRKIMRWALQNWQRVKFLNRYLAGTWLPRLQMDFSTGLRCAAHFVIIAEKPLSSIDDYIAGGRAMQRFWLEATRLGLQFQPEMTPLIFSRYQAQGRHFTTVSSEQVLAAKLAGRLGDILQDDGNALQRVYMGRVGFGPSPESRSIRPSLEKLIITGRD